VAKIWTGTKSPRTYLRRLSIVFADELRLKIVTELYMREMSATQFYEEFGGGSISRVHRHFKKLAEHGWLRLIRSESGGHRRGSTEHFYRATELAVFDQETWTQVPYSIRVSYSWRTFKQLAERVRAALQANTLDARPKSQLNWTSLLLDETGWDRVIAAAAKLFESIFEEQADAKLRIFHSEEGSILATVALAVFESPPSNRGPADGQLRSQLVEGPDSPVPFPLRLSKVFADELCLKIVAATNLREMSVPQFHSEFGGASIDGVRRRFKMLEEICWLTEVGQKTGGRRRGAVEQFFRATGPAVFKDEAWAEVPDSIKTSSWRSFDRLSNQVKEAIEAGTFEARTDSHLSWSLLRLDQLGWEKVAAEMDALSTLIFEEERQARHRIAESAEKPITATVALAAFESPEDAAKAP
jgi:DNA-binding transcriptional ArsR family regulator